MIMIMRMPRLDYTDAYADLGLRCSHMTSHNENHAYSTILKILPPKTESFQIKKSHIFFLISAPTIYCGYSLEPPRRGGSNEYLQSMF